MIENPASDRGVRIFLQECAGRRVVGLGRPFVGAQKNRSRKPPSKEGVSVRSDIPAAVVKRPAAVDDF